MNQADKLHQRSRPTKAQAQVLELLSMFEYLTTGELCEYLAGATTKRAMERKLKRMEQKGLVRSDPLYPGRGRASARAWTLLKKGAEAIGAKYDGGARVGPKTATPRQAEILRLLAEMKHLTTEQIHKHLHGGRSRAYTWQLLNQMQQRGYIRGQRLYPERGAASQCYWTIRKRGAAAAETRYDRRYLRRPARRTIEHRGLLLELARQVEEAGWSLLKPAVYNRMQARPPETPQSLHLVEAVLRKEELAIQGLLSRGYAASSLRDRTERLRARQVGAVVPRGANDYVAYVAGEPELTVLLMPHPPWAGPGFWKRHSGTRRSTSTATGTMAARPVRKLSPSRISRYSRLAQVVPVIAVFTSEDVGHRYAELLDAAGFHWVSAEQLGAKLGSLESSPNASHEHQVLSHSELVSS